MIRMITKKFSNESLLCDEPEHLKANCYAFKIVIEKQKMNETKDEDNNYCLGAVCEEMCLSAIPIMKSNYWCVHSGTSSHMTNDKSFFNKLVITEKEKVYVANNEIIYSEGRGSEIRRCILMVALRHYEAYGTWILKSLWCC